MVPANKILTVAYGTFSCTLEGFDDPFSAMTDIAEYFRDLAADDRFFGAEPPTPDMATLRTIAETKARHSVTARTDGGKVVLRPAAIAPQEDVLAGTTGDAGEASYADMGDVENATYDRLEEGTAGAADIGADAASGDAEVVAGAPQSEDVEVSEEEAVVTADMDAVTDRNAEPAGDTFGDDALAAAFRDDALIGSVDDEIEEPFAYGAPDIAPADEDDDRIVISSAGEDVTSAGDDVTSAGDEAVETAPSAKKALHDESERGVDAIARTVRVRRIRRVENTAAVVVATESVTPADAQGDALEGALTNDAEDDDLMSELAAIEAELARDATGLKATGAKETKDDIADESIDGAEDDDGIVGLLSFDEGVDDGAQDAEGDDLAAELAAIRADDSVALNRDHEGGDEDAVVADAPNAGAETGKLKTKDSEELREADSGNEPDEGHVQAEAHAPATPAEEIAASDPDVERLFAATDSRLSGPDTSRRHANISHLKAAVAARRADGPVEPREEKETDAYRADLASNVLPRRPSGTTEEPQADRSVRPAPLMLVSEQRVVETFETDATAASGSTGRPAEEDVSSDMDDGTGGVGVAAEDFERFAAEVGATELPDILEAAAVYNARVMGEDSFSRPRLLHLASEACDDLSREDGLRGFGQLLRDGRIRKVSRGTFALASESRYATDADRRVG